MAYDVEYEWTTAALDARAALDELLAVVRERCHGVTTHDVRHGSPPHDWIAVDVATAESATTIGLEVYIATAEERDSDSLRAVAVLTLGGDVDEVLFACVHEALSLDLSATVREVG